ncbi:hypothetical protein KJ782_07300 [Patescibacteria group bacterium]|nr:hypothetical protein [Patescibacteria group bacterium]
MNRTVSQVLDQINTIAKGVEISTRRKRKLRREHLIGAFTIARLAVNGLAIVLPHARVAARVLNSIATGATTTAAIVPVSTKKKSKKSRRDAPGAVLADDMTAKVRQEQG